MKHEIIIGDCLDSLAELPPDTFQTCITSPPYYGLRDYGVDGQIGLEDSLEEHISALMDVFRAVSRVLRPDGTLWLNYGDAYQDKQLLGLPWRLAFALQADGWWLRSDIIWHKPNPMPGSVTDRPTSSHEYMFLLSPSQKYFYDADAVREKAVTKIGTMGEFGNKNAAARNVKELTGNMAPGIKYVRKEFRNLRDVWTIPTQPLSAAHFATFPPKLVEPCIKAGSSEKGRCPACGAPWRRIVDVTTSNSRQGVGYTKNCKMRNDAERPGSYSGHKRITQGWEPTCECSDAPPAPCKVLDPFGGAGTVGLVADRLGRDSTLLELNPEYAELARKRLIDDAPLLCEVKIL